MYAAVPPGLRGNASAPSCSKRAIRSCDLSASDRRRLGAGDDDALLWLAIVMMEPSGALTVNLRAPIVINPRTMTGQQVLPHNCLYPLRHVLVDAE